MQKLCELKWLRILPKNPGMFPRKLKEHGRLTGVIAALFEPSVTDALRQSSPRGGLQIFPLHEHLRQVFVSSRSSRTTHADECVVPPER